MSSSDASRPAETQGSGRAGAGLRWTGIAVVLACACLRATTNSTLLPGWDLDPTIFAIPPTGLGPTESIAVDLAMACGAVAALAGHMLVGGILCWWMWILVLAGAGGALVHAQFIAPITIESRQIACAWTAAMLAAFAVHSCSSDRSIQRVALATVLGMVGLLALKSTYQVFVEHPTTVSRFQADKASILAANGWSPESAAARAYERRLMQPEATGWFGLSNVLATFAAGAVVFSGILAVVLVAGRRSRQGLAWIALFGLSAAMLFLTHSKGGYTAAVVGFATGAAAYWARRRAAARTGSSPLLTLIGPAALILPLLLLLLRGLIGERWGELSLLFRWMYAKAAVRIALSEPFAGVGPAGFQDAYLLLKDPLNPEEVSSPHCIVLDWWATLGAAGICWIIVLVAMSLRLGRQVEAPPAPGPSSARAETRCIVMVAALALLGAMHSDRLLLTPDGAIVRLAGAALWILLALFVRRSLDGNRGRTPAPAVIGCGAAILAHSQIDLAGSLASSASLFLVFLGALAAQENLSDSSSPKRPRAAAFMAALPVGLVMVFMGRWLIQTNTWQSRLAEAAQRANVVATVRDRLGPTPSLSPLAQSQKFAEGISILESELDRPVDPTPENLQKAVTDLQTRLLPVAARTLRQASDLIPDTWQPRREAAAIYIRLAEMSRHEGDRPAATDAIRRALSLFEEPRGRAGASELRWRGSLFERAAALTDANDADLSRSYRLTSLESLQSSFSRDPYNAETALRCFRLNSDLGNTAAAANWAKQALQLNELLRLDAAAKQLDTASIKELEAALVQP